MRAGQPVDVAGGEQQRRHRARDQKIPAERPMQPEPQPDAGRDRAGVKYGDSVEAPHAMDRAYSDIATPFPRVPGLAGAREAIRVGPRERPGGEDGFAVANVP